MWDFWVSYVTALWHVWLYISSKGKSLKEVKAELEEDVVAILKLMALNGVVSNPQKTVFMLFK